MVSRRIIYLINPISGTRSKDSLIQMISRVTTERTIPFEILYTHPQGIYENLKQKILDELITDVVVCGGDGTMSILAGALRGMNVRFGLIPRGSGNSLAYALSIPMNAVKALDLILDGKDDEVDGFLINGQFSCMLCGVGFDARVADDFSKASTRGLKTYVRLSAIHYLRAPTYHFTILTDSVQLEFNAYFISIANSNQFGNRFVIAPRASLRDGLLDIVVVKKMNKLMLPILLLKQVAGINTLQDIHGEMSDPSKPGRRIIYFQAPSLKIINHDRAPIHIDGEPIPTSKEIDVIVLPKAFRLIQPGVIH